MRDRNCGAQLRQATRPSSTFEANNDRNVVRGPRPGPRLFGDRHGGDPVAEQAYREIARLTRGAYCRFDPGAAHELAALLRAAAAYAAGGMSALADLSARRDAGATKLLQQMR